MWSFLVHAKRDAIRTFNRMLNDFHLQPQPGWYMRCIDDEQQPRHTWADRLSQEPLHSFWDLPSRKILDTQEHKAQVLAYSSYPVFKHQTSLSSMFQVFSQVLVNGYYLNLCQSPEVSLPIPRFHNREEVSATAVQDWDYTRDVLFVFYPDPSPSFLKYL